MPSMMQRHCIYVLHSSVLTHPLVDKTLSYSSSVYTRESLWTRQRRQQTSPFASCNTSFLALHVRSSLSGQLYTKIACPKSLNSCRYSYPFRIDIHAHEVEGSKFQRRTYYAPSLTTKTIHKTRFLEQDHHGNAMGRIRTRFSI